MTIKTCSCGKVCTTKNVTNLGRGDVGTEFEAGYFNCSNCGSTFVIASRRLRQELEHLEEYRARIREVSYDVEIIPNDDMLADME